jgi:hypothetical protein
VTFDSMPTGAFTCEVTLELSRAPKFAQEEKGGVTYLVARGYEFGYKTTLHFASGAELPVRATLLGELNQQVVIRDARGRPVQTSGYVQGLVEIADTAGRVIFRGRYYDSRVVQPLSGDDALTATGQRVSDHWENGFGEGPCAGHAFSMGVRLTREGNAPMRGQGRGQID